MRDLAVFPMPADTFFSHIGSPAALGALFDYLPEVYLFVKDADHKFTMVNQALWRMHGCRSEADMLGKSDWDFHHPVMAREYIDEDTRIMKSGEPLVDQVWLVPGADAQPRWYISTKMPLRDAKGRVIGIAGVMRAYEHAGGAPGEFRRLAPAIEHVLKKFDQPIEIANLAHEAGLSVSQFQREFKRLFRTSPRDYVIEVRLAAARRRLENTSDPLGVIAQDCGFYDQSYFIKRFKTATGLRPLEYRRKFHVRRFDPKQ